MIKMISLNKKMCSGMIICIRKNKLGYATIINIPRLLGPERGKRICAPTLNQEAISSWHLLAKENLVFFMECHWVYKPHLGAGPTTSSRQPTQKELNLPHDALFGHYFVLLIFLLYINGLRLLRVCVHMCVCVNVYACVCICVSLSCTFSF